MSFINYSGIESSKMIANTIAIGLLFYMTCIILSSLKYFDIKKALNTGTNVSWNYIILSTIISFFLFNGYDSIIKVSGELINEENTKLGLYATLGLTSGFYILIIISCLCVLGFSKTIYDISPITDLYSKLYNPTIGFLAYSFGLVNLFNTAFLSSLTATRFMYGCGKENKVSFSDFWAKLNENKAPINAIIVTLIIAVIFACINNEVILSVFANTSLFIILISICLCILAIRWKERNDPEKQKNNYIFGNINNIPIIVVIELILIVFMFINVLLNKFYINMK